MASKRLRDMFGEVGDLGEYVGLDPIAGSPDPLLVGWRQAAADASAAYAHWARARDADSYATYRACADRADAAQDAVAADRGYAG